MSFFAVSILESAVCCPRALAGAGNGFMDTPKGVVCSGFGSRDTEACRVLIFRRNFGNRSGTRYDWSVFARAKLTEDTAAASAAVSLEAQDDSGQEEDEEEVDEYAEEIERRLVSGERVLQISKAGVKYKEETKKALSDDLRGQNGRENVTDQEIESLKLRTLWKSSFRACICGHHEPLTGQNFTVSSLLDKIRRGRLDLRPSYQRDYVWDKRTASKLIESVLLNIPLPTMFFHEKSQGHLEVVDGKQRLTSIWSFMEEQRFPDGSEFALTGLEVLEKLNGNKYTDLDECLREAMQDFALNVHTISRHSDAEVVFEVFERLNMGSTQLNEQELRNCVFQGRYNDLLEELSLHPDMLRVFRHETPHKRMRDREFILRFFALRRSGIENFYLPVKNWLNNEMRRHQLLEEEDFMVMKFDFQRCLSLASNVFGEQMFRLPRGQRYESDPNVCLWDTIMYGFLRYRDDSRVLSKKKVLLLALNDLLVYDAEFKNNLLSTPKALKIRTKKWLLVLREVLGPS